MPPDQYKFQKAPQDFQSARLFGAAEPLLEAIESRGRMHPADQKLIILSRLYATNLANPFANASAEGRAMGIEQTIDYAPQLSMNL